MTQFRMDRIRPSSKNIFIYGPGDLRIIIDFDDVGGEVEQQARQVLDLLNIHWKEPERSDS